LRPLRVRTDPTRILGTARRAATDSGDYNTRLQSPGVQVLQEKVAHGLPLILMEGAGASFRQLVLWLAGRRRMILV